MYVMKKGKDCLFIIEESSRKIVESYDFSEYREALDDLNELNNQENKKIKAIDIEVAKEKLFKMFNGMQIRNIHTLKTA